MCCVLCCGLLPSPFSSTDYFTFSYILVFIASHSLYLQLSGIPDYQQNRAVSCPTSRIWSPNLNSVIYFYLNLLSVPVIVALNQTADNWAEYLLSVRSDQGQVILLGRWSKYFLKLRERWQTYTGVYIFTLGWYKKRYRTDEVIWMRRNMWSS